MTPAFSNWHAFFAMDGYGFYVWLAVTFTLIPLLVLIFHTLLQHRRVLKDIEQRQRRARRIRHAKTTNSIPPAVAGDEP